jgi:hypothetical protein
MEKKLKLSDVVTKIPFKISKGMSTEGLKKLHENHYNDIYDTDVFLPSIGKNLQRKYVWKPQQQQEFIKSILKRINIPNLSWIQYKKSPSQNLTIVTYKIIDGKQRFITAMRFIDNKFPIEVNGEKYYYKDFDEEAKCLIDTFSFSVDVAYEYDYDMISDESKLDWFEMINFYGTPQDIKHITDLKKK